AKNNSACLIADDHGVFRRGLATLVRDSLGIKVVLEAEDLAGALAQLSDARLVLALVDLRMPGVTGTQDIGRLREARPGLPVAVISGSDDRNDMLACLAAGVHGYILKSAEDDQIVEALKQIMGGQIYAPPALAEAPRKSSGGAQDAPSLTPRQKDVLELLVAGKTNKEIARQLDLSESTVKIHVAALFRALGVRNRVEAVKVAREQQR
ncbi:MAG: response regulator transcription factor, partial [Pseudomonadota bacterium]|nr:response regulator transcription factor [Pseudomonadota bacterium]